MQSLYDGLTGLGIGDERILYEAFGSATVLKRDAMAKHRPAKAGSVYGPIAVSFARSDIWADWSPDQGNGMARQLDVIWEKIVDGATK